MALACVCRYPGGRSTKPGDGVRSYGLGPALGRGLLALVTAMVALCPMRAQPVPACTATIASIAGSRVTLEMRNGDLLQGTVASEVGGVITLDSSYGPVKIPAASVAKIDSCAIAPQVTAESVAPPSVAKAPPALKQYGLEKVTASLGFCASAQRDESYSASPTFYAFARNTRTLLNLSASYDDKWKAAANSSNVTQVYSGKLQEMLFLNKPAVLVLGGSTYRNNSQGVVVEEADNVGVAKTFVPTPTSGIELDADIRAIYDEMNAPGPTVWLAGSNLSASLSKCFPARSASVCGQSSSAVAVKVGGIPVFNRAGSWQAYGTFDAYRQLSQTISAGLSVVDNYFEIAPKGYNKNYVKIGLSLKYTPAATSQ